MKNLTWQNPEQLFVAQVLINKVKSKCCGIKEHYIFVGKEIEKETSQTICFYREYTCWSPNNNEKETLEINTSVDWIDIKSRETAKDRYMAPTFDPMQTIEAALQNLKMQDL